ncbi:hypothetical protein GBAR_LOCUS9307 [Geodia barretti]|uniref:Uncharacterized protein n=1 Tax=Geodia barretti TaxID=519541 RepID=A0AA35RNR1_GEOBA|nr:hypothetical protein GBAR_LOCUS9307 [Geodia barretti]
MSAGSGTAAGGGSAAGSGGMGNADPESHYGHDGVKVYCHEGEGEGNEHLDSMDLLDVKSELERDAEKSETPPNASTATASSSSSATTSVSSAVHQIRSVLSPSMVSQHTPIQKNTLHSQSNIHLALYLQYDVCGKVFA